MVSSSLLAPCAGGPAAQLHALVDQLVAEHEARLHRVRGENEQLRHQAVSLRKQLESSREALPGTVYHVEEPAPTPRSTPPRPRRTGSNEIYPPPEEAPPGLGPAAPDTLLGFRRRSSGGDSKVDVPSEPVGEPPTAPLPIKTHNGKALRQAASMEDCGKGLLSRTFSTLALPYESKAKVGSEREVGDLSAAAATAHRRGSGILEHGDEGDLIVLRRDVVKERRLAQEYEQDLVRKRAGVRGLMMLKRRLSTYPDGQVNDNRQKVLDFIAWWMFDATIGFVIMANAITVGIETSHVVNDQDVPVAVTVLEGIFLIVYIVELGLRFYAVGIRVLQSHWVKFDLFLVVCGIIDSLVKVSYAGQASSFFDKVMLIRLLRLVRLIRAARLVMQFRTLFLLVQGLCLSTMPMVWTFLIFVFLVYIFAVFGMELIRSTDEYGPEYSAIVEDNFKNLSDAMMTLMQFVMMDSVGTIYRPIISNRPELAIFFISFILLGSVSLMNLVTAIMVESSLRQAKEDQDAQKAWESLKRRQMAPKLKALFRALDLDSSGSVDIDEIKEAPPEIKDQLLRICNMDDLEETFQMLDHDNSGNVEIEEFCSSIMRVQADKPAELVCIMKQTSQILELTREQARRNGHAPPRRSACARELPDEDVWKQTNDWE